VSKEIEQAISKLVEEREDYLDFTLGPSRGQGVPIQKVEVGCRYIAKFFSPDIEHDVIIKRVEYSPWGWDRHALITVLYMSGSKQGTERSWKIYRDEGMFYPVDDVSGEDE